MKKFYYIVKITILYNKNMSSSTKKILIKRKDIEAKAEDYQSVTGISDLWARYNTTYKVIDDYIGEITKHNRYKTMHGVYDGFIVDDRSGLIDLFEMALEQDAHIRATIETLESQILGDRYSLGKMDDSGDFKVNREETGKIRGTVFDEAIRGIMEAKLYGYTLLEIFPYIDEFSGKISHIKSVERRNVLPNQNKVVLNANDPSSKTWDISSKLYRDNYILIKTNDLGLFSTTTPLVLAKKFALGSYVNFTNTYGMPIIHGKSSEASLKSKRDMAVAIADSVNDRIIVTGREDTIEVKSMNQSNSERIYIGLLEIINKDISNVVLGSESMAGATQSYVGSTKAHQDIFRDRISVYRQFIENVMNEQVLPRLKKFGYISEDMEFRYNKRVDMSLAEKLEAIQILSASYDIPEDYIMSEFDINVKKKEFGVGVAGGSSENGGRKLSDEEYFKRYGKTREEASSSKIVNILNKRDNG